MIVKSTPPSTRKLSQETVISTCHAGHELKPSGAMAVIAWPQSGPVRVVVQTLHARQLFSRDRMYILLGLTGQIGQSMCEWMVSNSAGCVCLTSWHPSVDPSWLRSVQGRGAAVKVLTVDITDKDSLSSALKTVKDTCKPIAGVVNGANVLSDMPFADMSPEFMSLAQRHKVDGS